MMSGRGGGRVGNSPYRVGNSPPQIWWFWRFLRTFPWVDRAHTLGFCSTHGYSKTLKYGPHRPTGRFSKIAKITKFSVLIMSTLMSTLRMHYLEGPTLLPHNGLGWYRDCSIRVSMIVLNTF